MKTQDTEICANRGAICKRGSALVVVMCFAAILLIICTSLHSMSTQLAFTVTGYRYRTQALAMAEAGVADVLEKLNSDFETYKAATVSNTLPNGGTYSVTTRTNGATGAIIMSTGTYMNRSEQTVLESLGTWVSSWDRNNFKDFGIYAKGFVDVNGGGTLKAGLYSGDSVEISPGCTVEGAVTTVGTVDNKGTIGGATNAHAVAVDVPTFDFGYYTNLATVYLGDVFIGDKVFKSETVNPPSHITCVVGNIKIQNGAIIMGALVATGDIVMTGGQISHAGFLDPTTGKQLPSLMSINGMVDILGGQTLYGFVYAKGDVKINGGDIIYGGVISQGIVDCRNNWIIYPGPGEVPPGIKPVGGYVTHVRIGGWLR